jgi:hypothetical protein
MARENRLQFHWVKIALYLAAPQIDARERPGKSHPTGLDKAYFPVRFERIVAVNLL